MSYCYNNRRSSRRRNKTPSRNRLLSSKNTRRNLWKTHSTMRRVSPDVIIAGSAPTTNSFGLLCNPTEFIRSPSDCGAILRQAPDSYHNYISRLKELYPLCKHDSANESSTQYSGHKITYGEMSYEGIEILYRHILQFSQPAFQYFLDVGSGRGKLCLYMASKPNIESSVGVELVIPRVNDAEQLKLDLSRQYSSYTNKCKFLNSDILQISLSGNHVEEVNIFPNKNNKIFVWFSNLCFDPTVTDNIYNKLVSEITSGSIICSSKMPTSVPNTLQKLGTVTIPMSWSADSTVFLFQKM